MSMLTLAKILKFIPESSRYKFLFSNYILVSGSTIMLNHDNIFMSSLNERKVASD